MSKIYKFLLLILLFTSPSPLSLFFSPTGECARKIAYAAYTPSDLGFCRLHPPPTPPTPPLTWSFVAYTLSDLHICRVI